MTSLSERISNAIHTANDFVETYFIWSNMKDIGEISEAEAAETAYFDAQATSTAESGRGRGDIPIGKWVE